MKKTILPLLIFWAIGLAVWIIYYYLVAESITNTTAHIGILFFIYISLIILCMQTMTTKENYILTGLWIGAVWLGITFVFSYAILFLGLILLCLGQTTGISQFTESIIGFQFIVIPTGLFAGIAKSLWVRFRKTLSI